MKITGKSKLQIFIYVFIFILPILLINNPLWSRVYSYVMIYGIMSSAMNLMNGYAGQFSLAVGAIAGFAAYTSANMMMKFNFPFLIALLLASLVASGVGVGLSFPGLRIRGFYFAITTLIIQNILVQVFLDWPDFTRGDSGLYGVPPPEILGFEIAGINYAYLSLIALAIIVYVIHKIVNSDWGLILKALRSDDILAGSLGINVTRYKILVYFISSFMIGIAGSLLAHISGVLSPRMFTIGLSFQMLVQNRVGGTGTIAGPLLGTALLVALPYGIREIYSIRDMLNGALLITISILAPQGLYGSPRIRRFFGLKEEITEPETQKGENI